MEILVNLPAKRTIQNLWNDRPVRLPSLQPGDALPLSVGIVDPISFPFDARLFAPRELDNITFRAALGVGFVIPVDGSFTLEGSSPISYDPSAYEISDALNAVQDIIDLGGITITGEDGFFRMTFNENGAQDLLTGDPGSLVPLSILDIQQAVAGDGDTQEVQTLRIVQSASALAALDTDSASAGITVTQVQGGGGGDNHQVRVALTGNIYLGTWLFSTSTGQSGPIGYDDSEAQVRNAVAAIVGVGTGNVDVRQEDTGTYLITFIGTLANTAIAGIAVDGTNLVAVQEKSGTLDLATPGVAMLLNGAEQRFVSLEIESQYGSDAPQKILRQDVLLTRPIIEPAMTSTQGGSSVGAAIESFFGSGALITVNSTGTTDLAPATDFALWSQRIVMQAGAVAYTRKITLDNAKAVEGAIFRINIELPATGSRVLEIYDNTIAGTLLQSLTSDSSGVGYFIFEAVFDGTNWKKTDGHYIA